MKRYSRILFAAVVAAVTLGALVGVAGANRLSVSTRTFSATWSPMTFTGGGFATTRCNVTLAGSLHSSTFTKTVGSLVGYITGASINACSGGEARANDETLPWHIRYAAFTGTLPNISSVRHNIVGFRFEAYNGLRCRYTSTAAAPVVGGFNLGVGGGLTSVSISNTPITSPDQFCPTIALSGSSVSNPAQFVRLI